MNNKNNIQHSNIFENDIKDKLENYPMPLDENIWKGIEKQLAPKKNRVIPYWYWISAGVAASLMLILILNPYRTSTSQLATPTINSQKNNVQQYSTAIEKNTHKLLDSNHKQYKQSVYSSNKKNTISHHSLNNTINTTSETITLNNNSQKNGIKTTTSNKLIENIQTEFQANEVKTVLANSVLQVNDSIPATKTEQKITSLPEIPDEFELPSNKKEKKGLKNWLIAANIGTSGNTNLDYTNAELYANDIPATSSQMLGENMQQLVRAENVYVLQPNEFDQTEHLNPISVGFSVKKNLTSSIGVSSGLVYTYLRSNYRLENQWRKANASLDLHYIGIPLQLTVKISEKKHWYYYFSAGAMIEKGIRSVYKQNIQYQNAASQQTNIYAKIDGVQTSANSALGVGYKLHKSWNVFIEPQLTYYFENNQPRSARTETPLNVGINGGMQVDF